ncbi:hypothetical protein BS78_09G158000 [Paspalum vaginatum]|nr:hypothetical protein BS78_09G158000 [Paspalum vaginatum]
MPDDGNSGCTDGTSSLSLSLSLSLCLPVYLSLCVYPCTHAFFVLPAAHGGGGSGSGTSAAVTILSVLQSFTDKRSNLSLVPSLSAVSTRSEGIVFHLCF